MAVFPQVIVALALLGAAFGLAAVPFGRRPRPDKRCPLGLIVPHPREPSSMLSFAALPSFLLLMTLARFGVLLAPVVDPLNSPDSRSRVFDAPQDVDVGLVLDYVERTQRFTYPPNTAVLTADAARRFESASRRERIEAVRDLAWWTAVCPNYAPFTVPRLARALRDPDPGVKGAAAIGLASTGGHGAAAIPDLLAGRGTSVRYFDHLVGEAVFFIEHSPRWPPAHECEDVATEELERRAAPAGDAQRVARHQ